MLFVLLNCDIQTKVGQLLNRTRRWRFYLQCSLLSDKFNKVSQGQQWSSGPGRWSDFLLPISCFHSPGEAERHALANILLPHQTAPTGTSKECVNYLIRTLKRYPLMSSHWAELLLASNLSSILLLMMIVPPSFISNVKISLSIFSLIFVSVVSCCYLSAGAGSTGTVETANTNTNTPYNWQHLTSVSSVLYLIVPLGWEDNETNYVVEMINCLISQRNIHQNMSIF